MQNNCGDTPEEIQEGDNQQDQEPEPQERVNLFIDYVEGHHTEGIVFLDGARCSVLVEEAFGHFGKNDVQDVHLSSKIVSNEVQSEGIKLSAQEQVGKVDLQEQIQDTQNFTSDQLRCKQVVDFYVFIESKKLSLDHSHSLVHCDLCRKGIVLTQFHVLTASHIMADGDHLHSVHQRLQLPIFHLPPNVMRSVKGQGLEEQHKRNPLVIGMVSHLVISVHWTHTWMRDVALIQHGLIQMSDYSESGGEIAECVDDMFRNSGISTGHAPDVLPNILPGRHQNRANQHHYECGSVVKLEGQVVDRDGLSPEFQVRRY